MQKFVEDERMVSSVREKLQELFNQPGRESMRLQLMQYLQQVLETAVKAWIFGLLDEPNFVLEWVSGERLFIRKLKIEMT